MTPLEDEVARLRAENALLLTTVLEIGLAQAEALNALARLHGPDRHHVGIEAEQARVVSEAAAKTLDALKPLVLS